MEPWYDGPVSLSHPYRLTTDFCAFSLGSWGLRIVQLSKSEVSEGSVTPFLSSSLKSALHAAPAKDNYPQFVALWGETLVWKYGNVRKASVNNCHKTETETCSHHDFSVVNWTICYRWCPNHAHRKVSTHNLIHWTLWVSSVCQSSGFMSQDFDSVKMLSVLKKCTQLTTLLMVKVD